MKKRIAVLISLFSLVVLFLTGCKNEYVKGEEIKATNEEVVIIDKLKSNFEENLICYFNGKEMENVEIENEEEIPSVKVNMLIQRERYFKIIIGEEEFVFANAEYNYRIIPNGSN